MKLSTKGQYGVKAMFDLAINYGSDPIPLKGIAERQGISEYYLEQLMAILRRGNLVKSVRGSQGGYVLSREPSQINVGEVLDVLEGPIEISECITEDAECSKMHYCPTRVIWIRIRSAINDVVDSVTLLDMVNDYNNLYKEHKDLIEKETE